MTDSHDFVTLSVGGQRFETTIETLTRMPDTFFSVIGSGQWKSSPDKIIRIDRSPRLFEYILDYLRFGLSDMRWPDSIYNEDTILSLYNESISYNLCELSDYLLKIICIENWSISTKINGIPAFVDIEDDDKLLHQVTLAVFEAPHTIIVGLKWLERNFPQSPLIQILNVERLRFVATPEPHHPHFNRGGHNNASSIRPDFSALMEKHRLEKSEDDLATYCMRKIIQLEAAQNDSIAAQSALLRERGQGFDSHLSSSKLSYTGQIQEAWKRRINRVGVNHSIRSGSDSFHGAGREINKMSDVGVSYTHCLFVSRGGAASSPWIFHFPTTTAITSTSTSNALLTQRQNRYANFFLEVNSRRDTMQNLSPVPESEERIATPWK